MTGFLVLSLLADKNHWDSGEFTLLRGNCTRAGGGSAPSFFKDWISPFFFSCSSRWCVLEAAT